MRWNVTTVIGGAKDKDVAKTITASFDEQNDGSSKAASGQAAAAASAVEAILGSGAFGTGPFHVSAAGYVGEGKKPDREQDDENALSITIREGEHYVNPAVEPDGEEA